MLGDCFDPGSVPVQAKQQVLRFKNDRSSRKFADENRSLEIEKAPAPSMSETEKRAFIESLERAEKEIESGNYRVLVPGRFLNDLKTKLSLDK